MSATLYPGGPPPFGYRRVALALEPVASEAAAVRAIFAGYLETRSLRELGAQLEAAGIRPRRAARWHKQVLAKVLANPVYVASVRTAAGTFPAALVDRATFDAVAERLRERAPRLLGNGRGEDQGAKVRATSSREGRP